MAHEGQLWEMALEHFGSDKLLQVVIEMWSHVTPARSVVEHLTNKQVSQDVLLEACQVSIRCGPQLRTVSTSLPTLSR